MKKILVFCVVIAAFGTAYPQFRLSVQGALNSPVGDFSDFAGRGYGINATGQFVQNNTLSYTIGLGYNHWSARTGLPVGWDYKYSTVPLTGGIRYNVYRGSFIPYIGAMLGIYFTSLSSVIAVGPIATSENNSDVHFGIVPLAGFTFPLSSSIAVDVNLQYNIITNKGSATNYVGINAGFMF
jgi:hypothetical protein